jgi:hypothetical protein
MPYAWFDKLCLDQKDLQQDLECLPVFEMSCTNLLVLCGPTYPTRLWCILELYVWFSMAQEKASKQITFVAVGDVTCGIQALLGFEVKDAHCFSAVDEAKLRSVIGEDTSR